MNLQSTRDLILLKYTARLLWVWLLTCCHSKKFGRCEFGEILLANNVRYSELGDWICLAEKCSELDSGKKKGHSNNSTEYGIFQFSNKFWCADEVFPNTNDCRMSCNDLLDDDLTDDLKCAWIAYEIKPSFGSWAPRFNKCKEIDTSTFIAGCEFNGTNNATEIAPIASKSETGRILAISLGILAVLILSVLSLVSYKCFQRFRQPRISISDEQLVQNAFRIVNDVCDTSFGDLTKVPVIHVLEVEVDVQNDLAVNALSLSSGMEDDNDNVNNNVTAASRSFNSSKDEEYKNKKYNVEEQDLKIDKSIIFGTGHFGIVYQAVYKNETVIAAKTVKDDANRISLLYELKVLACIGAHPHVIHFIGTCHEKEPNNKLYLLVEYCEFGSLRDYLKKRRLANLCNSITANYVQLEEVDDTNFDPFNYKIDDLSLKNMLIWSWQTADAMVYLASKKVIHGDLAARNILLKTKRLAKITDFGLSKKLYTYSVYSRSAEKDVPWRWLAPESLIDSLYSTQSDIWSFGITLWEIFSLAHLPYPELSCSSFLSKVEEGYRLEKPDRAPDAIYGIMERCWAVNPSDRPSFETIRGDLTKLLLDLE